MAHQLKEKIGQRYRRKQPIDRLFEPIDPLDGRRTGGGSRLYKKQMPIKETEFWFPRAWYHVVNCKPTGERSSARGVAVKKFLELLLCLLCKRLTQHEGSALYAERRPAPKGLEEISPGFQPWELSKNDSP